MFFNVKKCGRENIFVTTENFNFIVRSNIFRGKLIKGLKEIHYSHEELQ